MVNQLKILYLKSGLISNLSQSPYGSKVKQEQAIKSHLKGLQTNVLQQSPAAIQTAN